MIELIHQAIHNPDGVAVEMHYRDTSGQTTRRVVSPIRFVGETQFLALCLCREEPRRFTLSRCYAVKIVQASDVLMPVEIQEIREGER